MRGRVGLQAACHLKIVSTLVEHILNSLPVDIVWIVHVFAPLMSINDLIGQMSSISLGPLHVGQSGGRRTTVAASEVTMPRKANSHREADHIQRPKRKVGGSLAPSTSDHISQNFKIRQ